LNDPVVLYERFFLQNSKRRPSKADLEKQRAFIENYHYLLKETPDDEPIEFGD
jgi:hypothetical protein